MKIIQSLNATLDETIKLMKQIPQPPSEIRTESGNTSYNKAINMIIQRYKPTQKAYTGTKNEEFVKIEKKSSIWGYNLLKLTFNNDYIIRIKVTDFDLEKTLRDIKGLEPLGTQIETNKINLKNELAINYLREMPVKGNIAVIHWLNENLDSYFKKLNKNCLMKDYKPQLVIDMLKKRDYGSADIIEKKFNYKNSVYVMTFENGISLCFHTKAMPKQEPSKTLF